MVCWCLCVSGGFVSGSLGCLGWSRESKGLVEGELGACLRFVEREGGKCNFPHFPLPPHVPFPSLLSSLLSFPHFSSTTTADCCCLRGSPAVEGGRGGAAGAGGGAEAS